MGCGAAGGGKGQSSIGQTAVSESEDNQEQTRSGDTVKLRLWGGVPAEAGPQASCDEFNKLYQDK